MSKKYIFIIIFILFIIIFWYFKLQDNLNKKNNSSTINEKKSLNKIKDSTLENKIRNKNISLIDWKNIIIPNKEDIFKFFSSWTEDIIYEFLYKKRNNIIINQLDLNNMSIFFNKDYTIKEIKYYYYKNEEVIKKHEINNTNTGKIISNELNIKEYIKKIDHIIIDDKLNWKNFIEFILENKK